MRCSAILVLALLLGGCQRKPPPIPADAALGSSADVEHDIPAGKRVVDETMLRAQCLLSGIRTPPHVSSNTWQDVGRFEAGNSRYGWIIVSQPNADVPLQDARQYIQTVWSSLEHNKAVNASFELCAKDWEQALEHTIVTVLLRVSGTPTHGTFMVRGARADHGERSAERLVENVSLDQAMKAVVALASADIGVKLVPRGAPGQWFEAAQ